MKRTNQQNKALHKYCELMAQDLSDAGYSVQEVCTLPIQWTKENFKENIWKPVQKAMFPDITSTTDLNTVQLSEVYEQINLLIGEKFGVSHQFPSYWSEDEQRQQTKTKADN